MSIHVSYCNQDEGYLMAKVVVFGSFEVPPPNCTFDTLVLLESYAETWIGHALGISSLNFHYNEVRQEANHGSQETTSGLVATIKDIEVVAEEASNTGQAGKQDVSS